MIWRIEIKYKEGVFNPSAESVLKTIIDLGLKSISKVCVKQIYNIRGEISSSEIQKICQELLYDPITQEYSYQDVSYLSCHDEDKSDDVISLEIAYNPGVMDPVEHSTIKGIKDLGIKKVDAVHTAKKYLLYGKLTEKQMNVVVCC